MKRSLFRQLLFGFVILCSVASYVYLNSQDNEVAPSPSEKEMSGMEENQEMVLPEMVYIKKLVDASRMVSNFNPR